MPVYRVTVSRPTKGIERQDVEITTDLAVDSDEFAELAFDAADTRGNWFEWCNYQDWDYDYSVEDVTKLRNEPIVVGQGNLAV